MLNRWKPRVTVAAIIERDKRFLIVEEQTPKGLMLNNPAGHLERGESPEQACIREVLEETTYDFLPEFLTGIYLARTQHIDPSTGEDDITYIRFAFCGKLGDINPKLRLDTGIERTLWMSLDEIKQSQNRHRSPFLLQCVEDYLRGTRLGLNHIHVDPSIFT